MTALHPTPTRIALLRDIANSGNRQTVAITDAGCAVLAAATDREATR